MDLPGRAGVPPGDDSWVGVQDVLLNVSIATTNFTQDIQNIHLRGLGQANVPDSDSVRDEIQQRIQEHIDRLGTISGRTVPEEGIILFLFPLTAMLTK